MTVENQEAFHLYQTLEAAAEAVTAAMPEGMTISLNIRRESFSANVHQGTDWLISQGATFGQWYGFRHEDQRCQRDLIVRCDGWRLEGIQDNKEAGLSVEACRVENAEADLMRVLVDADLPDWKIFIAGPTWMQRHTENGKTPALVRLHGALFNTSIDDLQKTAAVLAQWVNENMHPTQPVDASAVQIVPGAGLTLELRESNGQEPSTHIQGEE